MSNYSAVIAFPVKSSSIIVAAVILAVHFSFIFVPRIVTAVNGLVPLFSADVAVPLEFLNFLIHLCSNKRGLLFIVVIMSFVPMCLCVPCAQSGSDFLNV